MASWSDYDDDWGGGVDFTLDMLNPFTMPSVYKFAKDPNSLTAIQTLYWPGVTTAGAYLASAMGGSVNPYHWSMYKYLVADKYRMMATKLGQVGPRIFNSPAVLPLAVVFGTAALAHEYASASGEHGGVSPHSSGMGMSPNDPGALEDLQNMDFQDFIDRLTTG